MAISGDGLSDRMSKIMRPNEAKRDEDVVYEIEKWEDEIQIILYLKILILRLRLFCLPYLYHKQ